MISCGKQCLTCDFPVHMDTYRGCGHGCLYCRVRKKYAIGDVSPLPSVKNLQNFISGKRGGETKWCDWDIPLHWGGNSDPFQPCELEHRVSLECLRVFAESGYPFIVSTKNPVMLTQEPYYSTVCKCNMVLQVSMACSKYDKLEPGAPNYEERLRAVAKLSPVVKRAIVRVQPFFPDALGEIIAELPRYKEAGVYGIIVDAFVSAKKAEGNDTGLRLVYFPEFDARTDDAEDTGAVPGNRAGIHLHDRRHFLAFGREGMLRMHGA